MNNQKNTYQPIKAISHIIAFLGLFLLEQLPLSFLILDKKDLGKNYSIYEKLAPVATIICLIISAAIIIYTFKRVNKFPNYKFTKKTWTIILVGTLLTALINLATVPFIHGKIDNVDALNQVAGKSIIILLIFSILVAPILEEIIFRGIFMNWFFVKQPLIAVIASGLVFGYVHAPFNAQTNWLYALSKILLGIVLAGVYYRTKNIKANITVHFLNNLLAILSGLVMSGVILF
ncbi:lysostaphin resistance A-like protein [Companilactobacillus sp. FL22-1]|uniref:CPBP family intramembrane glutamic endopeptidase n=1 Tax=Companilactobacillus sp. FL22-1 TaxID=3373892 RepID=UPI0037548A5C